MQLTISERLTLLTILPEQGDLSTLKIVREVREALSFTEAEHARYGIIIEEDTDTGMMTWQWDSAFNEETSEIAFGVRAKMLVLRQLEDLDKREVMEERHLSLCEKFGYPDE
jgi:hypothetical protein